MTLRVVLAEDSTLVREGVARLLDAAEGMEVVGTAADLPELERLVAATEPDVVVTDIRMPPGHSDEGIRIAAALREQRPSAGVVVLSQYAEAAYALALFEQGAEGRAYLLKERVAEVGELVSAIREVAAGGSVTDPKVVEQLVGANRRPRRSELDLLTPRELEVLEHMAQGRSNASIASALFLSERAIEKHSNSIFSKLGLSEEKDVNRRVKAVLVFLQDRSGGQGG
jgi:DNA-binding NarL/FixJ family response regulator